MPGRFSRRNLIELGLGGAAAGLAGGTAAHASAQTALTPLSRYPEEQKLGVAIVGLGKLSLEQLIPAFRHCGSARLAALVSGDRAKALRIAREYNLPADAVYDYRGFDRIARDPRIDIVYIVLPNFLHAEYTIRALQAGKHVLCEKPMATNVADSEKMVAEAKAAGRKLMIAYRCYYEPLNLDAMRRLRSRSLGRVRLLTTTMGRQADLSDPSDAWRLDMEKSGGGALADMGIYGVNAARYLLAEEPVEVRALGQTDRSDPRFKTTDDLISWQFRFASGTIATGSTSFAYHPTMAFDVQCEHGRIVADPAAFYGGNRLVVRSANGKAEEPKFAEIHQFAREMDWMAEAVRGKVPLLSPGEEGVQDMRLMEAILLSVRRNGAAVATDWGYRRAIDPAAYQLGDQLRAT